MMFASRVETSYSPWFVCFSEVYDLSSTASYEELNHLVAWAKASGKNLWHTHSWKECSSWNLRFSRQQPWDVTPCRMLERYRRFGGSLWVPTVEENNVNPEEGGSTFLRRVCKFLSHYTS
jgi:hypothetical protein